MRVMVFTILCSGIVWAQFKSNVPLVLAPTTVTDSKGNYVDGLTSEDLKLYDNNVPQQIQLDWVQYPIDLLVAIQTSNNSGPMIDKLGSSGILLTQLLAGEGGETAVLSFSDRVKVHQEFSSDPDAVIHALRMLRIEGGSAHILDALSQALSMLEQRSAGRRRIIVVIAEKRDRASETKLAAVMERVQKLNVAIYWLSYSPLLEPFTVKPKTMEDLKPEAERIKFPKCALCPAPDDRAAPLDLGPGGLVYALGELMRLKQPDLSVLFTKSTGGEALNFLKKNALEHAVQRIGEEVHRQYILRFEPKGDESRKFHALRVTLQNRTELQARTRAGYWALP